MSSEILRAESLSVGYGEKTVVEAVTLRARRGQILTLIGPNGAGKSTILKTLIRQLPPMGGAVFLSGRDLAEYSHQALARRSAAVLTVKPHPELMRCEDVVAAGRYPYTGRLGRLSESDWAVVRQTMCLVGLEELAQQDFDRLSDGQRKRVLLARALCQEPEVIIMDEPTSFLDIRNKLEFLHLLKTLVRQKQLAVVMSLHELDLAQKFSDQILCVKDGRVDRAGPPEEIFSGDYIRALYGVEHGSYNTLYGTAEPEGNGQPERVFVIGGGGSGVAVYRALWRRGVPFAAGVLHENDLDYPVAKALAARVVAERAFEPIAPETTQAALAVLRRCERVICCPEAFGTMNRANQALLDCANAHGLLTTIDQMDL